ncbi:MAG: glycogen debranching protein GlgX [Pseudomonadales bacterium]
MPDSVAQVHATPGKPLPLGCFAAPDGINFAVFSRHAESLSLELFAVASPRAPWFSIDLDPACHRTGDIWHVRLSGVPEDTTYAWRSAGPFDPESGHRFDAGELLLDPYTEALAGTKVWSSPPDGDPGAKPRCLVAKAQAFDWQGDCPPGHDWADTIIYETHVRGLSIDPSSGVAHPGTYLGLVEKIPHFVELGITALELMPVHEFPEHASMPVDPESGGSRPNYWGYNTAAFFAPKEGYSTRSYPGCQVNEFKTMVRALHAAGIEVILDVVFNHTAEGDQSGPTLSYRGFDNGIYYLLDPVDRSRYLNYSGCGNTLNCSHPVVRDHVLDCLRFWTSEMHVDGFRFDLASVLGRGERGELLADPPLIERIAEDPVLHRAKLIAEAWDAGGAYQVGSFPGERWSEWNGRYRDDVRRFWRGDPGMIGAFASRLCGSSDIYRHAGKQPLHSINFVTCHDGFTLNDLVSYRDKHNHANGEGNRDGSDANFSANYGAEGETGDPRIDALRVRQIKNFLATLMLSRGVPLLLGGDEFRRTQRGNNNAYCQDNALSWYDWSLLDAHREVFEFIARLIDFRKRHELLRSVEFYADGDLVWFDAGGRTPRWNESAGDLGFAIFGADGAPALCLLFNPTDDTVTFRLPEKVRAQDWKSAIDTAVGLDVRPPQQADSAGPQSLIGRSLRVLERAEAADEPAPLSRP